LQARWLSKVGDRLGVDLAVAPGWYSDFANDTPQAFRITGHGFGAWEAHEDLRVVAGVIYLDRYDVNLLPAGGLLWTPSEDQRHELIFPRPRFAWRVAEERHSAHWVYVAGEFGGNQWAVRRDGGANDVVVYHDYRLLVGWERRPADLGVNWRLETGWVTGRLVEYYLTDTGDYRPADTCATVQWFRVSCGFHPSAPPPWHRWLPTWPTRWAILQQRMWQPGHGCRWASCSSGWPMRPSGSDRVRPPCS